MDFSYIMDFTAEAEKGRETVTGFIEINKLQRNISVLDWAVMNIKRNEIGIFKVLVCIEIFLIFSFLHPTQVCFPSFHSIYGNSSC